MTKPDPPTDRRMSGPARSDARPAQGEPAKASRGPASWRDEERRLLLATVAEAYYLEGLGQAEIAARFDLTRSAISRLLTEAREVGIVDIRVNEQISVDDRLGDAMSVLAAGTRVMVMRTAGLPPEAATATVARSAARLVHDQLRTRRILCLTLGTMVHAVVRAMGRLEPLPIEVVQMCGSVGASDARVDSHATVQVLASAYGARATHLHAPFLVETPQMRDALRRNIGNALCVERCKAADVALVGLGTFDVAGSSLAQGGHVPADVLGALRAQGAVGDVGGFAIGQDGRAVLSEGYTPMMAIDMAGFLKLPCRIGAASGAFKAGIIRAALRGGLLSDLVIDSAAAEAILAAEVARG